GHRRQRRLLHELHEQLELGAVGLRLSRRLALRRFHLQLLGRIPVQRNHLTLRSERSERLEEWQQAVVRAPPFETRPCGPLLVSRDRRPVVELAVRCRQRARQLLGPSSPSLSLAPLPSIL